MDDMTKKSSDPGKYGGGAVAKKPWFDTFGIPSLDKLVMIVINLWGAPGSGKSTTAAGLFFLMKINKYKVELVTEYAKDLVWERHDTMFENQLSIFSEQNRRLHRLVDHGVDLAITDSPLLLPSFYKPNGYYREFDALVAETFHSYNNLNYFLNRVESFEKIGRRHNEEESLIISDKLQDFMKAHGVEFMNMEANPLTPQKIFDDIQRLQKGPIPMPFDLSRETESP